MATHVPLATNFHSSGALSAVAWPAQECLAVPQSFAAFLAMPKHFSFAAAGLSCATALPLMAPRATSPAIAEEMINLLFILLSFSNVQCGVRDSTLQLRFG